MNALALYFKSARMLIRCRMQYTLSFILETLSQVVMIGGETMAVLLIFDRFTALNQWTGSEILFFYGVMTTVFYIVENMARGVTNFGPLVRSGQLDGMFLRPRGIFLQVLCSGFDPRRLGAIAVGIAAMAIGSANAKIAWSAAKILCLVWSALGSIALIVGLFLIEASLCVFSVKSIEMVNILTYGGRSACQYPVDIYPKPLRILFMFVAPFGLTMHLPISYVLDKTMLGASEALVFLSPLAGFVFLALMLCAFSLALRRYRSTGS